MSASHGNTSSRKTVTRRVEWANMAHTVFVAGAFDQWQDVTSSGLVRLTGTGTGVGGFATYTHPFFEIEDLALSHDVRLDGATAAMAFPTALP